MDNRLKKPLITVLLLATAAAAQARDQFGGFKEHIDPGGMKPFTRDLGSLLGAATFHSGRSLGFSGFDVGIRGGVMLRPSGGNRVLRNRNVGAFGLPWVQAEIGLPFQLDGYIRGVSFQGLTITGGGLRYGITKGSDKPFAPHFLAAAVAHAVTHQHFTASHVGANLIMSAGIPVVTPYAGVGFDRTRVVARASDLHPSLVGQAATTFESRFTAGVSVRPFPFIYLLGAYTLTHRQSGFDAGFGVRF